MNIQPGAPVPLLLQLFDGSEAQSPVVRVLNPSGTLIFEADMSSVGGGLYQAEGFTMPEQPYVVAQYQVVGSTEYEMPIDVFYALPTVAIDEPLTQATRTLQQSVEKVADQLLFAKTELADTMTEEARKTQTQVQTLFDDRIPSYADFWTGDVIEEQVDASFWEGTVLSGTVEASDTE